MIDLPPNRANALRNNFAEDWDSFVERRCTAGHLAQHREQVFARSMARVKIHQLHGCMALAVPGSFGIERQ